MIIRAFLILMAFFASVLVASANCSGESLEITIFNPPQGEHILNSIRQTPSEISSSPGPGKTLAIATNELHRHLSKLHESVELFVDKNPSKCSIQLRLSFTPFPIIGSDQGYRIQRDDSKISITANNEIGLLYGTYDVLDQIGFRWFTPDQLWEVTPDSIDFSRVPTDQLNSPSIAIRGVRTDDGATIPDEYLLWMARNRFNLIGVDGANIALGRALGIRFEGGGHNIISKVLYSNRLVDGKRLIELHPEWYGMASDDCKKDPIPFGSDIYVNPCLGNRELTEFFVDDLCSRLVKGDLREIDILNVWPSDQLKFGLPATCIQSEPGITETDQLFLFYSAIMGGLQACLTKNAPSKKITLAGISYYDTWNKPSAKNFQKLLPFPNVKYIHVLYLNERSYAESLHTSKKTTNGRIAEAINEWATLVKAQGIGLGVCDYYNYSVYNSLPATFQNVLGDDFVAYRKWGLQLVSYMHPIGGDPGPRRLSESLRAKLAWSAIAVDSIARDYFDLVYSNSASEVSDLYKSINIATSNIAEMWGAVAGLSQLLGQSHYWAVPPLTSEQVRAALQDYLQGGLRTLPNVRQTYFAPLTSDFIGLARSIQELEKAAILVDSLQRKSAGINASRLRSDEKWIKFARGQYRALEAATRGQMPLSQGGIDPKDAVAQIDAALQEVLQYDFLNQTLSPINQRQTFKSTIDVLKRTLTRE
jgi:hypothetical protein